MQCTSAKICSATHKGVALLDYFMFMDGIIKKYKHAPAHLFVDEARYFFTGAVYQKKHLLMTPRTKEIFTNYLFKFVRKYRWELFEWVVLENHYHFLCHVPKSKKIPVVINTLHKTSAFHIKRELGIIVEPFWYQYWDRCIRNDRHYFETDAYILYNPIKHGCIKKIDDYPFSSYQQKKQPEKDNIKNFFLRYKPQNIDYYDDIDDF